jgi:hypothetical protein
MLQAASRIADGQVPYGDFWWYYPPGQPYLLAGLWEAFGPSLLWWRVVRVLSDAAVAVLAYRLARRHAPVGLSLAAWLAAACAMAFPSSPHPFPIALALVLGALLAVERRPLLAGLLIGVCAVWRLEFAAYAGLAIGLAHAYAEGAPRERLVRFGRFAAGAAGAAVLLYAPVVLSAGVGRSWELLVEYPLFDFGDYQSLPFPLDYDGPLNTSSIGGFFSDSAENLIHFYLPLALLIGLAGGLLALVPRLRRDDPWPLATGVFALGMAHYLLVRVDIFHTAPLAVMVAVLGAWGLAALRADALGGARRVAALAGSALAAFGFAWALAEGIDRRARGFEEETVAIDLPVADAVRARPMRALAVERAADYVRAHVPAGQPIYVATRRSDLVTSGNPLFYVLAERPNPTRYDIAAPGVVTSAPVQREIVRDLERARPRLVVRWTAPITAENEPNRAGESSGVRILDQYLEGKYRQVARLGYYVMLGRRDAPPEGAP